MTTAHESTHDVALQTPKAIRDKPWRVAFVNTHPIQYFAPMYAFLNATAELEVEAIYLSDYSLRGANDRAFGRPISWDIDLLSGYQSHFVAGAGSRSEMDHYASAFAPDLWRAVRDGKYDAVCVHGHSPAAMLLGVAAARSTGCAAFMRGETHLGLERSPLKKMLRAPLLRTVYACLDGVLAIGSANASFYRAMGVRADRIFRVPYTVDNARFTQQAKLSPEERKEIRASLGVVDDTPIVLYAAKFQRRKRPEDLLRAASKLAGRRFHLAMVGSGEMEEELVSLAQGLHLKNVSFPGFVNQSRLPGLYAACDVFVLPSQNEPWGLAINEAMCAGLPIVASREIGAVADLVRPGVNGHVFDAGDVDALASALDSIICDQGRRASMSAASKKIIATWSYAECASGLLTAVSSVRARSLVT